MKKFNTNRLRAFFMALLLVLTSTSTTNVLAKADDTDGSKKVIESSISKISDLENQIKDLNDKKQEDQSKIDELKEKLESCKD
ncbi:copper amine oxidase, partial [Aerococcus sp. UMB1112A]|nr:copper amine oxidase [Aerococcus sp. UMB1112A]